MTIDLDINDIQSLELRLRAKFSPAHIELTPPMHHDGVWTLDIRHEGRDYVVQWRIGTDQWGLSRITALTGYGEGPDETHDYAGIVVRLNALLSQKRTPIDTKTLFERLNEKRFRTYRENWKRIEAYSEEADHAAAHVLVLAGPNHFYVYPYSELSSDATLKALIEMFDDTTNVTVGEAVALLSDSNNYRQVLGLLNRNYGEAL